MSESADAPKSLAETFADDAVALVANQMPSAEAMGALVQGAVKMSELEVEITRLEEELKARKAERHTLSQKTLPDLFDRVMTDRIGIPDAWADLVVQPRYYANIASDWPEDQRERAFDALERADGGDLIKIEVSVAFGKDRINDARALVGAIKKWPKLGSAEVSMKKSVHWASLTAFVKSQTEAKVALPLADLGATVGRECVIKKRKGKPNG